MWNSILQGLYCFVSQHGEPAFNVKLLHIVSGCYDQGLGNCPLHREHITHLTFNSVSNGHGCYIGSILYT